MSLTKRLQEAAEQRKTQPPPPRRDADPARHAVIDLRPAAKPPRRSDDTVVVQPPADKTCPRCGTHAQVDINDRTRGVLHLSCPECFKMWQLSATDPPSGT